MLTWPKTVMPTARSLRMALVLSFICGCVASAQDKQNPTSSGDMYLLAGTPTSIYGTEGFPATLYQVGAGAKLEFVREVVPQGHGLIAVHPVRNAIFVGRDGPSVLTVIHVRDPKRQDDIPISLPESQNEVLFPPGSIMADFEASIASEPAQLSPVELIPFFTHASQYDPRRGDPTKGVLVSVSSDLETSIPRVQRDAWDKYSALRSEGALGGPQIIPSGIIGSVVHKRFAVDIFGHIIPVDTLPPSLSRTKALKAVAVSQEYVLLAVTGATPETYSPSSARVHVHDRTRNTWETVQLEGNATADQSRLFGEWLASRVSFLLQNPRPAPGRENERGFETASLPDVQNEYHAYFDHLKIWLSGTQILQNLRDGRKIRIDTGQEDSEILNVKGTEVFYRVNDAIYQTSIVGNKVGKITLLVQDQDVPEIHWIFWSK